MKTDYATVFDFIVTTTTERIDGIEDEYSETWDIVRKIDPTTADDVASILKLAEIASRLVAEKDRLLVLKAALSCAKDLTITVDSIVSQW